MSTEEKFFAAVDVVKSIPYDGTFEPSDEIMLKFYAYYKQATQGPCKSPKPYIWSTVSRNRWYAWKELGDMPIETAMESYIEELTKVIETMSYNEKIAKFLSLMGSFYEMVPSEADCSKSQTSHDQNYSEEMMQKSIFKNYQPPTISDIYHIIHKDDSYHNTRKINEDELRYSTSNNFTQSPRVTNFDYLKTSTKVYSQSSMSSSSSSTSDISNFDLLSNSSDLESDIVDEQETVQFLMKNQSSASCQLTTKQDLFILTFINLKNSMEDILRKIENLNSLARKENHEIRQIAKNAKTDAKMEWNLAQTAFILLWPVIIESVFS